MEITGSDSVIFTHTPPGEVFRRILGTIQARWPLALIERLDEPRFGPESLANFPLERLPNGAGWLLFYRDAAMVRHMGEQGYVPMRDGDGPFAVTARPRQDVEFKVTGLAELCVSDDPPRVGLPPDPYEAWFSTPLMFEITAVTPGDPGSHQFSRWVLEVVKRACRGLV